jgi:homogentisate 1,2-dioxygenase
MRKWISFPRIEGEATRQAHVGLPEGTYEREMGKEGFFGPATQLYHRHPPTNWSHWDGPLRPHAYDIGKLEHAGTSPWDARLLMSNASTRVRVWQCRQAMDHLVRNGDGDELLFVHNGSGELYCDFGRLTYRDGDYIMVPRGTMWRLEPAESTDLLMIEACNDSYVLPDKGILGDHAIFDPAVLDTPRIDAAFRAQQTEEDWRVVIKRREALTTVIYPFNPLDAKGWKGDLCVVRLNWRDIRPLMSHRYHLPPSAHSTFLAGRFVVCTFCPRPIESDPEALKVPFYHNNDDYDEVIFYHRGEFFSRDNIHPGMITFHPCGFPHGPHPGAFKKGAEHARKETDEVAVMIDTRDPLDIAADAEAVEWDGYLASWGGMAT